jgi:hypothetical protein
VAVVAAAALLVFGWYTGQALLNQALIKSWQRLDEARASPLYCHDDLETLLDRGAEPLSHGDDALLIASGEERRCLPARTDYAADGAGRGDAPETLCLLARRLQLEEDSLPCSKSD